MNQDSYYGGHAPYHGQHPGHQRPEARALPRNTGDLRPGDSVVSAKKTFFRSLDDQKQAYAILQSALSRPEIGRKGVQADDCGMYHVDDLIDVIRDEDRTLSYVTRDHMVELYLKDPLRRVIFQGDRLGILGGGLAIPPDRLYYATTAWVAERARSKGLMSTSKPYVSLSSDMEEACRKSFWFVKNSGQDMAVIEVDAKAAYEDHVQFSYAGRDGEFLVARLSPSYIVEISNYGPVGDAAGPSEYRPER